MNILTREVLITEESIKKLTKVPAINALCEAIWNSIDADATHIHIKTNRNESGLLQQISIEDNGKGIPYEKFDDCFTLFQKSWKKNNRRENNKLYHGQKGEGRFKLYAISENIQWDTTYQIEDKLEQYSISCNHHEPKKFTISEEVKLGKKCGTILYLNNLNKKGLELDSESLLYNLIAIFALFLESDSSLTIMLNENKLNPKPFILESNKGIFDIDIEGEIVEIKYRFIAWSKDFKYSSNKHTYFFDDDHNYILEKPSGVAGNITPHSVFLQTNYFHSFDGLYEEHTNIVDKIRKFYHPLLIDFLFFVRKKYAKEKFDEFKQERYYPFSTSLSEPIEIAQKEIFDLCAFKILEEDPKVLNKKDHSLSILFKLLKKVIEKDKNIANIVSEVLDLDEVEGKQFNQILKTTTLPKLISHYDELKRRLLFLDVLDDLVHEKFYVKHLRERTQLHKIIEKETWIFGDAFSDNIGSSDQALDSVIKNNFSIDNSEEKVKILTEELRKSKSEDNETLLRKIPDLYLWSSFHSNSGNIINNLVIELKAPKVKIGYTEIEQINKYRRGIMDNTRHRVNDLNRWTYYVISSKIKSDDTFRSEFVDYDNGLLWEGVKNIRVYCKTWESIIKESRRNIEKMKRELEIKISQEEKEVLLDQYLKDVKFNI